MAFKSAAQRRWFFANQGGSGSGSSKGKKEYKPGIDPVKTLVKQNERKMQKAVDEGNKEIYKNKKTAKRIEKYRNLKTDTRDKFYNEEKNSYSTERKAIHQQLLKKIDNKNAYPKKGEKPKVIFIGGLTASGKTSAVVKLIDREKGQPDYKAYPKFVYLNSDDFKSWLPGYNGLNAQSFHRESRDIMNKAVERYTKQKKQIIIDATLRRTKTIKGDIDDFKKKGYDVVLYGTNLPGEKAIQRATGRFKEEKRYVPLEMIKKNAEPVSKSVLKLRHKADKYAVFDTDVAYGEPPKLIESDTSLNLDRKQDSEKIVKTEKEWRDIGVDKSDLEGYDTKIHKKVKVRIR